VTGLLRRPIQVFVPHSDKEADRLDLLIHVHGAAFVVNPAAEKHAGHALAVTMNLGGGF
jgi:hypothetical protein